MGIVAELREAADVAREIDNLDLYRRILDLQGEVQELIQENRDLREKIRRLEEAQEFEGKLEFDQGVYWKQTEDGKEGPFCTRCWDSEEGRIRLHDYGRSRFKCPACETIVSHPDASGGSGIDPVRW